MLFKSSAIMSLAFIATAMLLLPLQAKADWKWDAVQITCDKDLNYFSLRTMALWDVQPKDDGTEERIEKQSGIYDIGRILKHPYTCNLPDYTIPQGKKISARTITVEIADYRNPRDKGMCAGVQTFNVLLRLNGKEINNYLINNCSNSDTHFTELDTFNLLSDCKLSDEPTEEKACQKSKVKP